MDRLLDGTGSRIDAAGRAQYLLNELGLKGDENPARLSGGEALKQVLQHEFAVILLDVVMESENAGLGRKTPFMDGH